MKQYRNEWKYFCTEQEIAMVKDRLDAVLERDCNSNTLGKYEIHSLYFDDDKNTCAKENEAGLSKRFKYRIRYYGNCSDSLYLERKEKMNGRCYKTKCPLSPEQYQKLISGNAQEVFWETDIPLLRQFCIHIMERNFTPKTIIDYERIAFVEEVTNIRITLDMNVTASSDTSRFLAGDYMQIPILEANRHILEVKFDSVLPGYFRRLITDRTFIWTSCSKYYLGRKKIQLTGCP